MKRLRATSLRSLSPPLRELLILLAFCALTAALTWPYVTRMRDAVADPGDPYLVAWILWWDYHQTFNDPLNLFHTNVFYPYRYTLAFSEHNYGLALLFFPLFAMGARPLTVHAVALFFGFALCGYGAFRLARTLTGSYGAAWVAGVIFAFVPYRFHLLSHLPYLFACWIPLLFEALVLFARERSRRRAVWLGLALFMTGLTTITWFTLSLVPFALAALFLIVRYGLARERDFWVRGGAALGAACVALLPFMLPYYIASKMYGFKRSIEEVTVHSAWPIHWLSAENRNKLWFGMGEHLPLGLRFKLFPGLLPLLLPLAALFLGGRARVEDETKDARVKRKRRVLLWLDTLAVVAFSALIVAKGFTDARNTWFNLFGYITSERAALVLVALVAARLSIEYPRILRRREGDENLIATLRSERRSDTFWLGSTLAVVGFCYSLGTNFVFYRILYDLIPLFKSMRVPTRGAMFCYLGLALLSGLGARRLAEAASRRRFGPRAPTVVYAVLVVALLAELNGAPLQFMRGDVYPDEVTLRLKETTMRGGIVVLPAGPDYNHRHMLRAADHARPLVVGTSGFNPPYVDQIEMLTRTPPLRSNLLDLLEKIPVSYLVVQNKLLTPDRRPDYELFLMRAVSAGRLRFIRRFGESDDLYAVTKTEPEAVSEQEPPFDITSTEWATLISQDPIHLLGQYREWSQFLYRMHVAAYGRMPRFAEYLPDAQAIGRRVAVEGEGQESILEENARSLAHEWSKRQQFAEAHAGSTNEEYVEALLANARLAPESAGRASLVDELNDGSATRADVLLRVAQNPEFSKQEFNRSLVLLHYFAYLRRDPDDPPDTDLRGFNHWVRELDRGGSYENLSRAFADSIEYWRLTKHGRRFGI